MLDDLKYINSKDKDDALGVIKNQWQQLEYQFSFDIKAFKPKNIVLSGMGGSAFPALFISTWLDLEVPFNVVRDYELPAYVDKNSLFIASSYSGNTEETLSALSHAEKRQAKIVVVSAGGHLLETAKLKNYCLLQIPGNIQPRMSSFYFLAGLTQLFQRLGLTSQANLQQLSQAGLWLKDQTKNWQATVPVRKNPAKQLALELIGRSVVIYSGPKLFPAANKFKICLNENAKNLAWVNQYPEFNHNEFIGWTSHPVDKPYALVEIRSKLEHERVQKRFLVSERLLSGKRPSPNVIKPLGDSLIKQLIWTANFGDYTSVYLALLNGVDPTPVALVEKLKQALN